MEQGRTVFRGGAFLSTSGEPYHYVQQGVVTGVESDGVQLVRIAPLASDSQPRFEAITGWRSEGREALLDARRMLDDIEQRFMERMVAAKAAVAERINALDAAGQIVEVQA